MLVELHIVVIDEYVASTHLIEESEPRQKPRLKDHERSKVRLCRSASFKLWISLTELRKTLTRSNSESLQIPTEPWRFFDKSQESDA